MKITINYTDKEAAIMQKLANSFNVKNFESSTGIRQKTVKEICKNNVKISAKNASVEYYRNGGNCMDVEVNEKFTIVVTKAFIKFQKMIITAGKFLLTTLTACQEEFFSDNPTVTQKGKESSIFDAFIEMANTDDE